ncbi:MAG: hypothetical protein KDK70_22500 [Myxococcales bacterium]|nr:hypothetical protein [Myxococcales bacterium]
MSRTSLLLAALLVVPACDGGTKDDPAKTAKTDDQAKDPPAKAEAEAKPAPEPAVDPWQQKLAARVLADSGLGKDGKLTAFDIVNCESGEKYCQVCRFGNSPKVMAVGSVDDPAFHEDLKDLDAIVKKYGDDKIKGFAVITEIVDGKGVTPKDIDALQKQANELREKLAVSIPIVVPAPDDSGKNREWDEYYNITKSRTVMFADGRNAVKYSAVGPEDFSELNAAIESVLSG